MGQRTNLQKRRREKRAQNGRVVHGDTATHKIETAGGIEAEAGAEVASDAMSIAMSIADIGIGVRTDIIEVKGGTGVRAVDPEMKEKKGSLSIDAEAEVGRGEVNLAHDLVKDGVLVLRRDAGRGQMQDSSLRVLK